VRSFASFLSLLLVACSEAPPAIVDAGVAQADAGGGLDGGSARDAGPPDAGPVDAGPPIEVTFVDVALEVGLDAPQGVDPCFVEIEGLCEAAGFTGGAAVGDVDGDGWPDLLLTRSDGPPRLYRNAEGTFVEVGAAYGLDAVGVPTNGAAFADLDRDGDLDLYLTTLASAEDGEASFLDLRRDGDVFVAVDRGANVPGDRDRGGFSIAVGDYDRDGLLDLHVNDWVGLRGFDPPFTRLLHNLGDGRFEDVTRNSGASPFDADCWDGFGGACFQAVGFASAFVDFDQDGHPDLLSVRDFGGSRLYWNDGDGTFTDGTEEAEVGTDENGMGSTVGDVDGDGDLDWFVTAVGDPDMSCGPRDCNWGYTGNRLYRYDGDRAFTDVTDDAGVRNGGWGWGAAFLDFENDGDLDLVMTNGFLEDRLDFEDIFNADPMMAWENDGEGRFVDVSERLGFLDTGSGKGLLVFDYDRDGDQDVLIVRNTDRPLLYENRRGDEAGRWLRLRARARESAPAGRGAEVRVWPRLDDPPLLRTFDSVTHFLGQSERVAHVGLGRLVTRVARVEVRWPSGRVEVREDVAVDQLLVVDEADAVAP
jgi:hypothetical protein